MVKMKRYMDRNILVELVVKFYFDTGLLDESVLKRGEIKIIVDDCLDKPEYLETIINTIIIKAKTHKVTDVEMLKAMLLELERIRLELEYKEYNAVS